ncbi:phage baseplate assembly protein V [Fastidiosibacter lacustris]|uniref:phage baseplate assembly protein V n=1 Tax=Fastidiosibacter lacustris TaxID=2056695 RepID=UPI000E342A03|nr:phage baseplate assembly protein V [Fastidiosibacter lacustris]
MDVMQYLTDMQRRLNNLVRVGTVIETNDTRLKVKLGDNSTGWLPWVTQRTGDCVTWWKPSVGEQVLVLSPSGELNNGIVLPAIYTKNQPTLNQNEHTTVYKDGTRISYDYAQKKLSVNCVGDIEITAAKMLTADITDSVTIKGAKTLSIDFAGNIDIKTPTQVKIDAPNMICTGNLLVQGGLTYMQGMTGYNQGGGKTATIQGAINVTDDVVAGGISLKGHMHTGDSGGSTSAPK